MLQELALKGKFNQVDGVILGTNRDEGRYLMPILMPVPNAPHSDVHERHVSDSLYSDTCCQALQLYNIVQDHAWYITGGRPA